MSSAMSDLDRVRAVTANFFFWQGLRWVPMGFVLMLCAFIPYAKTVVAEPWLSIVTFGMLIGALWLSTDVLGRYYTRAYGRVQGIPGQHARRSTVKWLVVYPAMFAAMLLDWKLDAPVFLSGVVFAAGIEAYRRSTGGGRKHYVVAEAILALSTLAPLSGLTTSRELLLPFIGLLGAIY